MFDVLWCFDQAALVWRMSTGRGWARGTICIASGKAAPGVSHKFKTSKCLRQTLMLFSVQVEGHAWHFMQQVESRHVRKSKSPKMSEWTIKKIRTIDSGGHPRLLWLPCPWLSVQYPAPSDAPQRQESFPSDKTRNPGGIAWEPPLEAEVVFSNYTQRLLKPKMLLS